MGKINQDKSKNTAGDYLRDILAESEDVVLVIDDSGFVRYANPVAETTLTPGDETLIGTCYGIPAIEGNYHFHLINSPHKMAAIQISRLGKSTLVIVRESVPPIRQERIPVSISGLARVGTWRFDKIQNRFSWSDLTQDVLGIYAKPSESLENFLDLIPEVAHEEIQKILERSWIEGEIDEIELPLIPKTGEKYWLNVLCQPEFIEGELIALQGTFQDITKQHEAEIQLSISQQRFKQVFDNSINGFALHEIVRDENGAAIDFRFLDVNAAFEVHTGIKREDAIGKLATEVLSGIEETDLIQIYGDIALTGEAQRFERFYEPLHRYYLVTAFSTAPNQFATIFMDITERREAEEAIRKSERDFRTLFDSMTQGIVYQDRSGRIISANRAAEHILGLTFDELKGQSSFDQHWKAIKMNGEPLPGADHPAMVALHTGKTVSGYAFGIFNPKRNDTVWIDVSAVPQFHEGEEEPYQVFTTFLEITDQIRVQQALEERIKELRSLSRVGRIIHQENEMEDICTLVGLELVNGMRHPDLAVATIEIGGQKISTKENIPETPYRLKAPIKIQSETIGLISVFYTEDKAFILPEERTLLEGIAEWIGLWYQQRRTQGQLVESEKRFRNAIMNAPNPIMIHAEDGEIIEVNDGWLQGSGYDREELKTVYDWVRLAHPNHIDEIQQMVKMNFAEAIAGHEGEYPVMSKSGEELNWHFSSAPLGNLADGRVVVITVAIDITNRVQAEEDKLQYYNRIMALREIDQVIVSTLELDEVLDLITSHLGNLIKFDSMSILAIDGDDLEVIACKGFTNPEEIMRFRFPSAPGYPNYEVIKNRTPMALTDVSKEYPTFQQPSQFNLQGDIKAWLGIPLFNRHEVIGMFTIDRCDEEPYTEQEIEVAMQYANRAAIAITNARLFEQAVDHLRKLEILREIDGTITSSMDMSDALHTVLEQVKVGLNVDVATVFLFDEEEQALTYQQSFGYRTEGNPDYKVPIGQGYVGTVAARMEPLYIPEVDLVDDGHRYPFSLADEGVVSYYGFPLITKGELQGVLQVLQRTKLDPSPDWIEFAKALAGQTAIAVDNLTLFKGLERANKELREAYDATIEGWAHALEIRDKETEGHSRRVVLLTEQVALAFGIDPKALVHIRRGVLLHDIGKMGVPDQILHKPGPLNDMEWEIMRQHPVYAYEMLKSIEYLKPALPIPHYHHERWDGSGYPEGLKGKNIPLEARIFAVVDAYDALTSDRPYRGAWSEDETVKYLRKQAGREFDPEVVEKFLKIVRK